MPTISSAFDRLRAKVPLFSKVFASKVFDLSEQIEAILHDRDMSRRDLARLLGKSDAEVSKWLSGTHNLTLESVAKLEAALKADLLVTPRKQEGYFGHKPKRMPISAVMVPVSNNAKYTVLPVVTQPLPLPVMDSVTAGQMKPMKAA
ncbi:helix-turn-helix domain-containing protein [Hymenobacter crusticola]|uniref:HTH cro/C1-type domain-containing protein n=1 Tax=Hymenobacter crusticola TaxID=1770526 RepID=A0A243W6U9_9BACT|nr:helix-turn-helix transcriptional regulator [Hymenobacter crusticola]OUJ69938.1 hypothetical protein BXP70_25695 [Hymenobacter crusticola]